MTGVRGYIRDNLPHSWEVILKKNGVIHKFIEQFYNGIAEQKNKNGYHCMVTMRRAHHYLTKTNVATIAYAMKFKEGTSYWNEIQNQINNYEQNCK